MRVIVASVAALALSAEAFSPGLNAPVARQSRVAASPVAQFGSGNFDRKSYKKAQKKKADEADKSAQVDVVGLATVAASAIGVPLIVLGGLYFAGPGKMTPFSFTDGLSPFAVAEKSGNAAKRSVFDEARAGEVKLAADAKAAADAKIAKEAEKAAKAEAEVKAREARLADTVEAKVRLRRRFVYHEHTRTHAQEADPRVCPRSWQHARLSKTSICDTTEWIGYRIDTDIYMYTYIYTHTHTHTHRHTHT